MVDISESQSDFLSVDLSEVLECAGSSVTCELTHLCNKGLTFRTEICPPNVS